MAQNKQSNSIAWCKMPNVGFIKQQMNGEGVFSSPFNLVNYQSLLLNLVRLGPCPKLSLLIECSRLG